MIHGEDIWDDNINVIQKSRDKIIFLIIWWVPQ